MTTQLQTHFATVHFERQQNQTQHGQWICKDSGHEMELGKVYWYNTWRQYCFYPVKYGVFSAANLTDISTFLQALNEEERT